LTEPFDIADGVVIPPGSYHWTRFRLEGELAAKRKFSGQFTWWFGNFYNGSLDQIELELSWKPTALFTLEFSAERNLGRLPAGDFTKDLIETRLLLNFSPDLQVSSLLQYDNESDSFGTNTRLRWTFNPLGDIFLIYNHNLRELNDRLVRDNYQLLVKLQYTFRR
ncbi:MAG: hypothetical protein ACE5NG_05965, partial [bacterium]